MRRNPLVLTVFCGLLGSSIATALLMAPDASAKGCARVYWRSIRNRDQICPRSHSMLSDIGWTKLRWSNWGVSGATGRGVEVHHDAICGGQPLRCHDQTNPIKVHLTHAKRCPDGKRIYSRIDLVEYSGNGRHVASRSNWSYDCTPSLPASGFGAGGG